MDGENWELQFIYSNGGSATTGAPGVKRRFIRAANIKHDRLNGLVARAHTEDEQVDQRILELAEFLVTARLPFPAVDKYEYWLLDAKDDTPLALIFSCVEAAQMQSFPSLTEWTALPAAVMPIATTDLERSRFYGPVNYRLERCVAERAGARPKARWFTRGLDELDEFPSYLVREDWENEEYYELCQRYLQRQSPRLLMLHGLRHEERRRMELSAKAYPLDVARFYSLYPTVADEEIMRAIRIEAKLRIAAGEQGHSLKRRDGVLYL